VNLALALFWALAHPTIHGGHLAFIPAAVKKFCFAFLNSPWCDTSKDVMKKTKGKPRGAPKKKKIQSDVYLKDGH
jgi:hypothetical protein